MKDLIVIQELTPAIFADKGIDPILADIKKKAADFKSDISTEEGRKELKSFVYKIKRSKTALDDLGKDLVSEWKAKSKLVDAERKRLRDELDALRDEVRKPLTDWEDKDDARKANHGDKINYIFEHGNDCLAHWHTLSIETLKEGLVYVGDFKTRDWEEFQSKAIKTILEAEKRINEAMEKRNAYDEEQKELERLRKEVEERKQKEREEEIKRAAIQKVEVEKLCLIREKEEAERKTQEAEQRVKDAEIEAERKAEADKIEAERKTQEAVELERKRVEAIEKTKREEVAKREADEEHKGKVIGAAVQDLVDAGVDFQQAAKAIEAIRMHRVKSVSINF